MSPNNSRILAIDPGTRNIGVAVLQNGKLLYHGVQVIRGRKSPHETLREGRRIILRLIKDFRPQTLAVEKAYFRNNKNRYSSLLNIFVDEIFALGKRKRLRIIGYAPSTVKKVICGNGRASKQEVARAVITRFPELKVYLTQDRAWKESYHQHMFDAVAVGNI
ncbi:MAG: crossover junction endodeoxyribonuclease RuvC [Patescibacteria group bacterium]